VPELPEVETMCRGLRPVVGRRIASVEKPRSAYRPITMRPTIASIRRRLGGQRIAAVERLGKRVVIRVDGGDRLLLHPRMAGLVLIGDPPSQTHVRLRIVLADSPTLALTFWDRRGLGTVELLTEEQFARLRRDGTLGPDALTVSPSILRERLAASRREIKTALLDQQAIAGIGNLYASEILHVARIHPQRRCHELRAHHWRRLSGAISDVLEEAIRLEGSTLADGTYRNALNQNGSYQNHHRVYDRAGEACENCGKSEIVRIVQAQRSTFFCPRCQRKQRQTRGQVTQSST